MTKGQVKVVSMIHGKKNGIVFSRQIPTFFVVAICFETAKSIVKDRFKGQNISGQMMDSNGNMEEF